MTRFESFDSFEQMQAAMGKHHDAAMAGMGAHQRRLLGMRKFHWVRPYEELGCFIFGAYDLDDWIAEERRLAAADPEDSYVDVARIEHNNMDRGYKSGRAYSIIEPTGELGDTHCSTMYQISARAFLEAQIVGWVVDAETRLKAPVLYAELAAYATAEPGQAPWDR